MPSPPLLTDLSIPPFMKPGDLFRMGMLFVLQLIDHLLGYHIFTASSIYNDITYLSAGGTPCSSDVGSQPIIIARPSRSMICLLDLVGVLWYARERQVGAGLSK